MSGVRIGLATHYYDRLGVAVLTLTDIIRAGDYVHIVGHATDFYQKVTSLQINHQAVPEARPGQDVALKVRRRVRPHDVVYHATAEETDKALQEDMPELSKVE